MSAKGTAIKAGLFLYKVNLRSGFVLGTHVQNVQYISTPYTGRGEGG